MVKTEKQISIMMPWISNVTNLNLLTRRFRYSVIYCFVSDNERKNMKEYRKKSVEIIELSSNSIINKIALYHLSSQFNMVITRDAAQKAVDSNANDTGVCTV